MRSLIMIPLMLLAGCGGGGGGGGGGDPLPPSGMTVIGNRDLPGYAVHVMADGARVAGSALRIETTVITEAGQTPPSLVEAAVGSSAPETWLAGSPDPDRSGSWCWTVTLPTVMDGQRVWVRLLDPQLNSIESGVDDFALVP